MNLAKFFVAIFIGVFLSAFFSQAVSLIYSVPEYTPASNYITDPCLQMVYDACGKTFTNHTEYDACGEEKVYSTEKYKKCLTTSDGNAKYDPNLYTKKLQTYELVNIVLYLLLGVIFVILGFFLIKKESIGTGLILGGSFLALLGGLAEGVKEEGLQLIINFVQMSLSGLMLAVFIVFSYFRLER